MPRAIWWLIPPMGRHSRAAIIHDWLYASKVMPRAMADATFLAIMLEDDVPEWLAQPMYWAVRGCGWLAWYGWI